MLLDAPGPRRCIVRPSAGDAPAEPGYAVSLGHPSPFSVCLSSSWSANADSLPAHHMLTRPAYGNEAVTGGTTIFLSRRDHKTEQSPAWTHMSDSSCSS